MSQAANKSEQEYDNRFFEWLTESSLQSAIHCVPLVYDLVSPNSVVDVGCGTGAFLSVFQSHGVKNITGIDGAYVPKEKLIISSSCFFPHDISHSFQLGRTFDLAISLEVAEHLDEAVSDEFIYSLVQLAPIIWFSAAIPAQEGICHVNLQWPSYWIGKFAQYGYMVLDILRCQWMGNNHIAWWYSQNSFLFVRKTELYRYPKIIAYLGAMNDWQGTAVVHPKLYENKLKIIKNLHDKQKE